MPLHTLGGLVRLLNAQLLIDKLPLFPETRHTFTEIKVFEMSTGYRTDEFLLLFAFVDAFVITSIDIIKV